MDLEPDETETTPLAFGMDFDSDAFHLYLVTETPSVELYLPSQHRFRQKEGLYQALYSLPDQEIELAAGEESAYARYMVNAHTKIEQYFETGISMPVPVYGKLYRSRMERTARTYCDVGAYRVRLRSLQRKELLEANITQAIRNVQVIDAILRVLRRVALDFCALIGAVELPIWRAHGDLAGIVLYPGQIEGFSQEEHERVALLERWGVPLHIAERCEQSSRYELDASSRPELGQPIKEKLHQQKLAGVHGTGLELKEVHVLEDTTVLPHQLPPRLEAADGIEQELDDLILAALMPSDNAERIPFDEFSLRLEHMTCSNTAPVSWRRRKYEAGQHGDVEGRLWQRGRYYPFHTRNVAVLFGRHAVPPHYHNPTLPFPLRNGQIPAPLINPPTVPLDLWHCLELRYFSNIEAMGDVTQFHPSILAYHAIRTRLTAHERGHQEGPKPFMLQFWGKDKSALERASQSLPRWFFFISCVQTESSDNPALPSNWTSFANVQYVALVLARSQLKTIREGLMGLLPTLTAPPTLHPEYKQLRVRYIHFLRHEILGGTRWTPLTSQKRSPVMPAVMDCYQFTNGYLLNLVSQPRLHSLSAADFVEFHRLQVILEMLSGLLSFKIQLVANSGPISRICRCISEAVRHDVSMGTPGCEYRPAHHIPSTLSRMEGISWTPAQQHFSLYLPPSNPDLRLLSLDELEEWRKKEEESLESELAKKKHQLRTGRSSASCF